MRLNLGWGRGTIVSCLVAGLFGCGTLWERPSRPESVSQDDVGAVHLAIVSVAPWADYVEWLQPHFELTADQALENVNRVGQLRRRAETASDAISIGAQQKGDAAQAPAAPAGGTGLRTASDLEMRDPKRDAMTDYWTATSLYQEVQLLNRYVYDAAIPKGYVPFVVRLQLTLLPRYRDAPYDAYSSISFFTTGDRRLNRDVWARGTDGDGAGEGDEPPSGVAGSAPRVLPLLVTDNLEAALATDEYARSRRISLTAAGTAGTTQLGVGAQSDRGLVEQNAGLDLNSLLTVTRLSENTLRVRLGAMQQGSQRFAMVPRTHKITLLVMVPKGAPAALQVLARTEMVNAETGKTLRPRTPERIEELMQAVADDYGVADASLIPEFLRLAQQNAQQAFLELAAEHRIARAQLLWVDTVGLLSGGQYSSSLVDLDGPRVEMKPVSPPEQTVYLEDDGTQLTGELVGGQHLLLEPVRVEVHVGGQTLPGVRVVPVDGGRALRFQCRSLRAHGIEPASLRVRLMLGSQEIDFDQVQYRAPAKAAPPKTPPANPK